MCVWTCLKRDRMPIQDFFALFGGGIASTIKGAMDSLCGHGLDQSLHPSTLPIVIDKINVLTIIKQPHFLDNPPLSVSIIETASPSTFTYTSQVCLPICYGKEVTTILTPIHWFLQLFLFSAFKVEIQF